jgi:hypothetical protein
MFRRRPPLSTREIAAYRSGIRLCQLWLSYADRPSPDRRWVMSELAAEDASVLCALGARKWWRWFDRGWDDWAGERAWP